MTKTAMLASGLLCVAGALANARAELLVYEPFDYLAGASLIGQNLGHGFANPWTAGGNVRNSVIQSGSFAYTDSFGNSIVARGNRALATGNGTATGSNTGGDTGSASPRRTLSFYRGADAVPTTTWFSVLATVTSLPNPYTNSLGNVANYGRAVSPLQLFYNGTPGNLGQGNEQFGVGRGTENTAGIDQTHTMDSWGLINRGTAVQEVTSDIGFASLPPDFLLLRIDHAPGIDPRVAGAADTAYLWINPPNLAKEPTLAKADLTFTPGSVDPANDRDYVFNVLRLFGGSVAAAVGYGSVELDEIKIGTAFMDVTLAPVPEPSTFALLGLGVAALVVWRRRK